jgi:predicted unusual protein kinase regulating ubiquinone biosynthesis (AarF/ABC1/UbiB family)
VPKLLRWQHTQYSPLKRQLEIFGVVVQFLFYLGRDRLLGNNTPYHRHCRAKWLVGKLLDLGPTFIKIGQSLSTRVDLLPLEYIQELTQLQDRVPPFSSEQAIAVIEVEFGKSISTLFREFELVPLASASLGQVHRARLYTGETVAVKVQRPGLEGILNLDFAVLHRLIRLVNSYLPGVRKFDLEAIYQEFFELLFREIDYINEGKNADRFRKNFHNVSQIRVPRIYWQYATRKVLTLEYLPGIKVSDRASLEAEGIKVDSIVQLGICSYLKQLLEDGFFQSDPHPGNMAVNAAGELIFYDFGTMTEVKPMSKDRMVQTFFAIIRKDTDKLVEALIYMGLIEPIADLSTIKRILAFLLEEFREKPLNVKAFEAISDEVYLMFKEQPFRLPPEMTFIIKSLTTLDGIARALDPQYNLLAASQPFFTNLALSEGKGELMSSLVKQTKDFLQRTWQRPSKSERSLQQLEEKIERGELEFRVRSQENERILKRIHQSIKCLIYACLTGFSLIAAAILLSSTYPKLAIIFFSLSGLCCLFLLRSLIVLAIQEKL